MPDFNFVGPEYTAPSIYQGAQECINWYCEVSPAKPGSVYYGFLGQQQSRGVVALYPTPGLDPKITSFPAAEVRGMHTCAGGNNLLVVVGNTLYAVAADLTYTASGTLTTSSGQVSIDDNGLNAMIVDGQNRYYCALNGTGFTQLPNTDGPWSGADMVAVADNYFLYNRPNTQQWAASTALSATTPALSFSSKDGSPDNLVALISSQREIYLLGEYSSEVWADVGDFPFPYARIPGSNSQTGCAAKFSVARLNDSFVWLSKDTRGQARVMQMNGYTPTRISTHAVEYDLVGEVVSDAVGYTYQIEGHEFYVLSFPTADKTWVYDGVTNLWHKRLWVDSNNVFHRHRSNCQALFQGMVLVGDYQNGKIYQLNDSVYTDDGGVIKRVRRAPHLVADFQRMFFEELQIQFQPGVGLSVGQGYDPQAMLRWSDDGGATWSQEYWRGIGKIGAYKNRCIWRRMGWARDRVFEVVVTDPINAVVISANLKANSGDN